jgi:ribosomal protein S18 acetylase RimI-like enzyme
MEPILQSEISGTGYKLRFASGADAEKLVRLINTAFVVEQVAIAGDRVDRMGVERYMGTGKFLVLEGAGCLAGCIYVEKRGDRGYLGLLAVDPAQQKRGLGRKLTDAAEQFFKEHGCDGVDLRVISARAELLSFYERLGYAVTHTSAMPAEVPLKIPCHFIHMSKNLLQSSGAT